MSNNKVCDSACGWGRQGDLGVRSAGREVPGLAEALWLSGTPSVGDCVAVALGQTPLTIPSTRGYGGALFSGGAVRLGHASPVALEGELQAPLYPLRMPQTWTDTRAGLRLKRALAGGFLAGSVHLTWGWSSIREAEGCKSGTFGVFHESQRVRLAFRA